MKATYSAIGLCLVPAVVLAIACGKKKDEGAGSGTATAAAGDGGSAVTSDANAPEADAAAAPEVDAAAAAPPASGLSGRADGVGPLDEKFAVSMKALEAAFPGLVVKRV